jgi:hypothetical protein
LEDFDAEVDINSAWEMIKKVKKKSKAIPITGCGGL